MFKFNSSYIDNNSNKRLRYELIARILNIRITKSNKTYKKKNRTRCPRLRIQK